MVRAGFLDNATAQPVNRTAAQALALAEKLPALIQDAKRLAATISHGVHGRRRSGIGENFWQFRPFTAGEPAGRIDWRRSARDHRLYVREREWEASRTIWFWIDRSVSMQYASDLAMAPKIDRAVVLALALAKILNEAGERVGLTGLTGPLASRRIIEKLAMTLAETPPPQSDDDTLPSMPVGPRDEIILVSDFFIPLPDLERSISMLSNQGASGHLVSVNDPVEETFPFEGQAVLFEKERGFSMRIGDAASWRQSYFNRLAAFRTALAEHARARGWSMTLHHTDRPASETALKVMTLLGEFSGHESGRSRSGAA